MLSRIYKQCADYPANPSAAEIRRIIEQLIDSARRAPPESVRQGVQELEAAIELEAAKYMRSARSAEYAARHGKGDQRPRRKRDDDLDQAADTDKMRPKKRRKTEPVVEFDSGAALPLDVLADVLKTYTRNGDIMKVGLAMSKPIRSLMQQQVALPGNVITATVEQGSMLDNWKKSNVTVSDFMTLNRYTDVVRLILELDRGDAHIKEFLASNQRLVFGHVTEIAIRVGNAQEMRAVWNTVLPRLSFPRATALTIHDTAEVVVDLQGRILKAAMPNLKHLDAPSCMIRDLAVETCSQLETLSAAVFGTDAFRVTGELSNLRELKVCRQHDEFHDGSHIDGLQDAGEVLVATLFPRLEKITFHGQALSLAGTFASLTLLKYSNCFDGSALTCETLVQSRYSPRPELVIAFSEMTTDASAMNDAIESINLLEFIPHLTRMVVERGDFPSRMDRQIEISGGKMPSLRSLKVEYVYHDDHEEPHTPTFVFDGAETLRELEYFSDAGDPIPEWVLSQPALKTLICGRKVLEPTSTSAFPCIAPTSIALGELPRKTAKWLPCLFPNARYVALNAVTASYRPPFVWRSVHGLAIDGRHTAAVTLSGATFPNVKVLVIENVRGFVVEDAFPRLECLRVIPGADKTTIEADIANFRERYPLVKVNVRGDFSDDVAVLRELASAEL